MTGRSIALFILLSTFATAAVAEVEVTPTLGYQTTSTNLSSNIVCIALNFAPCPDGGEIKDGLSLGLTVDIALSDAWMFEILLRRQTSDVELSSSFGCEACLELIGFGNEELEVTTLHVGALRQWNTGRVHPFAAIGGGLSSLSVDPFPFGAFRIDEERPSASLAAGVKVPVNTYLGVRFEARGYWIDLPEEVANEDLLRTEVSTGLTFRW